MSWNLFANKNLTFGFVKIFSDCKSKHCHSIQTFGLLDATVIDLPYLNTTYVTAVLYTLLYTFRYIHIHVYIFHRTNTNHNMYMFTSGHTAINMCRHLILVKYLCLLTYLVKIYAGTFLWSYTITNAWWWWLPFVHLSLTNKLLAGFCFSLVSAAPPLPSDSSQSCQKENRPVFASQFV